MSLIKSLILFVAVQLTYTFASYCGEDAIPFSFQALSNGQPVLGCARPSCFGWGDKHDNSSSARFYRIHKKNDGFVRKNDLKKYDKIKIAAKISQMALCEKNYASLACDENTQWVGGISPSSNITAQPLFLQCCIFDSLKNSWDRGIADVAPGQIVVGGEVMQDDRQYAFDYIANINKYVKDDKSITYSVTMRRFRCVPYPTVSDVDVEENAQSFIINKMAINRTENATKTVYNGQTQIQQVDDDTDVPGNIVEQTSSKGISGSTNVNGPMNQFSSDGLKENTDLKNSFVQVQPESSVVLPSAPLLPGLSIQPLKQSSASLATINQASPSSINNNQPGTMALPNSAQRNFQQPLTVSQQSQQQQQQLSQPTFQQLQNFMPSPQQPNQQPQQPQQPFYQSQQQSSPFQPQQQPLFHPQHSSFQQSPQTLQPLQPTFQADQIFQPQLFQPLQQPESSKFPIFPSLDQLLNLPLLPTLPTPNPFG